MLGPESIHSHLSSRRFDKLHAATGHSSHNFAYSCAMGLLSGGDFSYFDACRHASERTAHGTLLGTLLCHSHIAYRHGRWIELGLVCARGVVLPWQ